MSVRTFNHYPIAIYTSCHDLDIANNMPITKKPDYILDLLNSAVEHKRHVQQANLELCKSIFTSIFSLLNPS